MSSKIIRNDIYKIYKVTVPRDYYNEELEDMLNWAPIGDFFKAGKKLIKISSEGYYKNPIVITSINNTYSVHPGGGRYLINRVNENMPPLEALVVNRYGTTEQMIANTFKCDPVIYEEDFVSYLAYRNKPQRKKIGHTIKPFQLTDKTKFNISIENKNFFSSSVEYKLRFFHMGEHLLDFGPEDKPVIQASIKDFTEFGRWVYEFFVEKSA